MAGMKGFFSGSRGRKPSNPQKPSSTRGGFDPTLPHLSAAQNAQDMRTQTLREVPPVSPQQYSERPLASKRHSTQHQLPPLSFQGRHDDEEDLFMSPKRSKTSDSATSGTQPRSESKCIPNNPQNPVKTEFELDADPIEQSNNVNIGSSQETSAVSPPCTPPRTSKTSAASHGASSKSPPPLARQTAQATVPDHLIAAQRAMNTFSRVNTLGPMPLSRQFRDIPIMVNSCLAHSSPKPARNSIHSKNQSPLPTHQREIEGGEDGESRDSPGDARTQKSGVTGETESQAQDEEAIASVENRPLDGEPDIGEAEHSSASSDIVSTTTAPEDNQPGNVAPSQVQSDAQFEDKSAKDDEEAADASPQYQHEGTGQAQVSLGASDSTNEELRQTQQETIAAVLSDYSNPTVLGAGDTESSRSGEFVHAGDEALDDQDLPVLVAADSSNDTDSPTQQVWESPDSDRCDVPANPEDGMPISRETSNIYNSIEEFLTEHKIPKKAGYDWLTTLLNWTSELKERRDAKLEALGRENAELREQLTDDAREKKRLLNEVKLMADAASRFSQELDQANLKLEICSENLNISSKKLGQTEKSKLAIEKTLHDCQIALSAKTSESAFYKGGFEESKEDLERKRQALEDVRVDLKTWQQLYKELSSRVETLSRRIDSERQKHRQEVARWSQHAESIEQEKKMVEDAATREAVRLGGIIQSLEQQVATLGAAYDRQSIEHAEAVKTLQVQHEGEIQDLKEEQIEGIRTLRSQHDGEIQDLKKDHNEAILVIQSQHGGIIRDIETKQAENARRIQSHHDQQVQQLKGEHSQKVLTLESQLSQLQSQRDQEVKDLNDQILQDNKAYLEKLNSLRADCDRRVKTEVDKAVKKQQQRIDGLEAAIVGSQDKYYMQISDTSFVTLLGTISQQITDLSAGVGRPSTHMFDRSLDPTNYLDRNPLERDRSWTIFVRSVCWSVLLDGFFEFPLGFGCLGSLGEGFERLYHLYLLFCRPTSDGTSLEFAGDKATNVWRASFFNALLKGVKASPNSTQQHEGPNTYPGMFKTNVDRVVKALTEKLLRLSNRQLDSRVPAQIFKLVYDVGTLSLQMGSQRAQVMLEPCESGELVRAGDRFVDEGGLTGIDTAVGLMTQPCMVRIGDGSMDTTSEHIIVKGRFIS